jgi:holo-[acyl-carrier protein] synthase
VILGIGLDLVEVARFERDVRGHGNGFLEELFSPREIAYCQGMRRPYPFYAARFAAREAFFKALGTGREGSMGWRDVEVHREASGKPFLVLHGETRRVAEERGVRRAHLSLTHTAEYAAATVVLEGEETR